MSFPDAGAEADHRGAQGGPMSSPGPPNWLAAELARRQRRPA